MFPASSSDDWAQSFVLTADFTILQQHICHHDPAHSFQLYLRSPHRLVSCVTVFPEDVCALYYSASSIMTPGFMSPSATFIASDILLLPLMDDNIPLNKPEQNLNLCRRWNVNLCVFCFRLQGYLFIFILDQLGAYVICGLLDHTAADAERSQRCFYRDEQFIIESKTI